MSKTFCVKCTLQTSTKDSARCSACTKLMHHQCIMGGKVQPSEFKKFTTKHSEFYFFCPKCIETKFAINKAAEKTLKSSKSQMISAANKIESDDKFAEIMKKMNSLMMLEKEAKNKIAETEHALRKEIDHRDNALEAFYDKLREKDSIIASLTAKIDQIPGTHSPPCAQIEENAGCGVNDGAAETNRKDSSLGDSIKRQLDRVETTIITNERYHNQSHQAN